MARRYTPRDLALDVKPCTTGKGLFTRVHIPEDTCIIEYTGVLLTPEKRAKSQSRYLFDVAPGKTIDGASQGNKARYINHSCDPNCEAIVHRGRVYVFALRDIKPGEQLGYDYGEAYMTENLNNECLCDSCLTEAEEG